jgi:hypothetical protein
MMGGSAAPPKSSSDSKASAPELVNDPVKFKGASYTWVRQPPINNGNSVQTIGIGSPLVVEFLIPPRVFNLAQTVLYYQMQIPAEAGGFIACPATTFGEIQSVTLVPEKGANPADVQEARNYLRIIGCKSLSKAEFDDKIQEDGIFPCGTSAAYNPTAAPPVYQAGGVAGGTSAPASLDQREPKYLKFGTATNQVYPSGAGTTETRRLKLGVFKGTLFAHDKDIFFPQNMTLRVVFSSQKAAFVTQSNVNPATGCTGLTNAAGISLSNLNLYMQCETDATIIKQVESYFKTPGVELPMEYLKFFKTVQAGSQHNPQITISSADGLTLRSVIASPFAQSEISNYALDNSNLINGTSAATSIQSGKVWQYRTLLNTEPEQKYDVSCIPPVSGVANVGQYPSDDWVYNKRFMTGSAMQNKEMYRLNWFIQSDYLNAPGLLSPMQADAFEVGGLPIDKSLKWEVVAQTCQDSAANYLTLYWYLYAVCGGKLIFAEGNELQRK